MAQRLGHLTGIHASLLSPPFALPTDSVSSPAEAAGPPLADLFTEHNQTHSDWPTVRLCLFTLESMHVRTESHGANGWALGKQKPGPEGAAGA